MDLKKLAAALACGSLLAFPAAAFGGHGPPHVSVEPGEDSISVNAMLGSGGDKLHVVCNADASEEELKCKQTG